jgi:YVTN family beta-propeller protein
MKITHSIYPLISMKIMNNKQGRFITRILIAAMVLISSYATISFAQTPTPSKQESILNPIFIAHRADNNVWTLPNETIWPSGLDMTYIDATDDGKIVVATSSGDNQIYVFNGTNGNIINKIKVGEFPTGIKVSPDKKFVIVPNQLPGTVSIIDLVDMKVINEIRVGMMPHNTVFSPSGTKAYLTIQGEDKVLVLDVNDSFKKVAEIKDGKGPHNLDITDDGKLIFVANAASSDIAVINTTTLEVIKKIPVSLGHHGIDISPNNKRVYVSGIGDDKINVIDIEELKLIKQVSVGKGPHGIRTSSDGENLYVAVTSTNELVVINTDTLEISEKIPIGKIPFWIAVPGNT